MGEKTYTIKSINLTQMMVLNLQFDGLSGAQVKSQLGGLSLHVHGSQFRFRDASTSTTAIAWSTDLNWEKWEEVKLYLTKPPVPKKPTGVTALPMDGAVRISWDDVSVRDEWIYIDSYEIQWRAKKGEWSAWRDVGDVNAFTGYLSNGTLYRFRVRAVGPGGASKTSDIVSAKPQKRPAPPTGLSGHSADGAVILTWDSHGDDSTWTDDKARWQYREISNEKWSVVAQRDANGAIVTDEKGKPVPAVDPVSFKVTGLNNGTAYDFQIRVRNDAGWSKPSGFSHQVTPQAAPAPPRGLLVPHNWTYIPKDDKGNPLGQAGREVPLHVRVGQQHYRDQHRHQRLQHACDE